MKVLVIPDIHLKTHMLLKARKIMLSGKADMAVFLGDIVDDWGCGDNDLLYKDVFEEVVKFKKDFPNSKYCVGNHELAYLYNMPCSGTSIKLLGLVTQLLYGLRHEFGADFGVAIRQDNVIFSHAGISEDWLKVHYERELSLGVSAEALLERINYLEDKDRRLWEDESPVWLRPSSQKLFLENKVLHVVGHTPVYEPTQEGGMLILDTFSTMPSGENIGNAKFVIINTETQEWEYADL